MLGAAVWVGAIAGAAILAWIVGPIVKALLDGVDELYRWGC